jgi:uncharacterized Rmd1/YagE family protein
MFKFSYTYLNQTIAAVFIACRICIKLFRLRSSASANFCLVLVLLMGICKEIYAIDKNLGAIA